MHKMPRPTTSTTSTGSTGSSGSISSDVVGGNNETQERSKNQGLRHYQKNQLIGSGGFGQVKGIDILLEYLDYLALETISH